MLRTLAPLPVMLLWTALSLAACSDSAGEAPPADTAPPGQDPTPPTAAAMPLTQRILEMSDLVPADAADAARGIAWYLRPVLAAGEQLDEMHAGWLAAERGERDAFDPRATAAHTARAAIDRYLDALLKPPVAPTAKLREDFFRDDPRGLAVRIRLARRALDDLDSELETVGLLEPMRAHLDALPQALDRATEFADRAPPTAIDPATALSEVTAAVSG